MKPKERLASYGIYLQIKETDLRTINRLRKLGYSYPQIFRAGIGAIVKSNSANIAELERKEAQEVNDDSKE